MHQPPLPKSMNPFGGIGSTLGVTLFCVAFSMFSAPTMTHAADQAGAVSGTLRTDGFCQYDWYQPPAFDHDMAALLDGQTITLESEFLWQENGDAGDHIVNGEHAVLAITQDHHRGTSSCTGAADAPQHPLLNSPQQPKQQWLWKTGAGAIVGAHGLGLELWRPNRTALVWSQEHGRCAVDTASDSVQPDQCLAASASDSAQHLTPAAQFELRKHVRYLVRVRIQPDTHRPAQRATLQATLHEIHPKTGQRTKIQQGQIGFSMGQYFPTQQPLNGTLARSAPNRQLSVHAPGDIQFKASGNAR